MEKKKISIDLEKYPREFCDILRNAVIYDSSCSENASVIYIDKDEGYFLKSAEKNSLKTEAELTEYFNKYNLATEVLGYVSYEKDYLLTRMVKGEDCTFKKYIENPCKLTDMLAQRLRLLHEMKISDCPVDRKETYIKSVEENYKKGMFENSLTEKTKKLTADEAYGIYLKEKDCLKNDVLIHGDYCLPNIMLDNWNFSAFIDVGNGGMGDRHIDLFWGMWSIEFNLKDKRYAQRFSDAYGKDKINPEMLDIIGAMECFG